MLRLHADIFHDLIKIAVGELSIEFLDQGLSFFPGDMMVPDLLGGVIGSPADAEFYKSSIIMQVVDLIVDTVILTVRTLRPEWPRLEACIFRGIIVYLLRRPSQIITQVMYLYVGPLQLIGRRRQEGHQVGHAHLVFFPQLFYRNTAQIQIVDIVEGMK